MKTPLWIVGAAIAGAGFASTPTSGHVRSSAELEAVVRQSIAATQPVPESGVAVIVVRGDQVLLKQGFGWRDRARKLPVTPATTFAIASMTKAFAAYTGAMLATHGRLNWEAPVRATLPEFGLRDPAADRQAALVDLMSHRTGVPRHDLLWLLSGYDRLGLVSRLRHLEFHPDPSRRFRKGMLYNNLMYGAAGTAIGRRAGMAWEDLVRRALLDPLGMTATGARTADFLRAPEPAIGYLDELRSPLLDWDALPAAAGMTTTLADLERWLGFLLRDGVLPDGKRLASAAHHAYLFTPKIHHPDLTLPIFYGLGWFIREIPGEAPLYYHDGSTAGFSSMIAFSPGRRLGIAVLANQWGSATPSRVINDVIQHLAPARGDATLRRDFAASRIVDVAPPRASKRAPGAGAVVSPADLGWYAHPGYGPMRIAASGGKAYLEYFRHRWLIYPTAKPDEFEVPIDWGAGALATYPMRIVRTPGSPAAIELPWEGNLAGLGHWTRFSRRF